MDRPGRRTFIVASVFLSLVGALHALAYSTEKTTDPALLAIEATLRATHVPLGLGMAPSLMAIQNSLALSVSGCLLWLGVLGAVIATSDASAQVLRRMTITYLAGCAGLVLLYAHYRIPPPFTTLALVEVMYLLSLIRQATGFRR